MRKLTSVFGYVRVSTENQLENYSIDEQTSRMKAYCSAMNFNLIKIYTDGGYSGGNTDRPALKQMLYDLRSSQIDAVLVYKLDRLSRSQKDTLTLIEDCFLANGIDFISINENFDTSTPFGRAMIGILSVFAQLEKDQITERFTMGRIGRCKAGYFHGGGNPPYGYSYVNGSLLINYDEAENVKKIYSLFLSGKSINSIYKIMCENGGGNWTPTKIRNILTNSVYSGKVKFSGLQYDGNHQPIITPCVFEAASNLFSSKKRENLKTSSQKTPFRAGYTLSGLLRCSSCGASYSAVHGYYKCYSRSKCSKKQIKDPDCKNCNWKIEELDNIIISFASHIIFSSDFISKQNEYSGGSNVINTEQALKELDRQREYLMDLYQFGCIPSDSLLKRLKKIESEKNAVKNMAAGTKPSSCSLAPLSADDIAENIKSLPVDTRRLLIRGLIESITIDGRHLIIQWRV